MIYIVRRARDSDLDSLVSFTVAEAREAEGLDMEVATVRRGVVAGLASGSVAVYWVVESDEGDVVASTSVVKEWSDWHARHYWWIQSMYVVPDHRGRGLSKMLIEAVSIEASKDGATDLRLYVHKNNERAIAAYRRCGFDDSSYAIMFKKLPK